jgi:hypothetical protein
LVVKLVFRFSTLGDLEMRALFAYLDPGSGSMMLQVIAGGLAAAAVTLKVYWRRLLVFLRIRKPEEETTPAQTESSS